MSGRVRVLDAVLAGLATLAAVLPLTTLFTPTAPWLGPSLLAVALVAVTGMAVRLVTAVRPVVVLAQVVVLFHVTAVTQLRGHLWNDVLPTPETGQALGILLGDAYSTIVSYSAPAPSTRGVVLGISLLVGLTALTVDAMSVTWRSPAAAGIPLLAAFLTSATNSGEGLAAWFVIPPALAWLAMVGRQGVGSLRSWGMASPRSSTGQDPTTAYANAARVAGVLALAAAVVLPGMLPHLPTTFLAEGLGRSDTGRGNGSSLRLSSSIDIARDLGDRSDEPVIVYESSATSTVPLRVAVLDTYRRGRWTSSTDFTFVPLDGRLPGTAADPAVERTTERIEVTTNRIGVPQVALPENATGSPFPGGSWQVTTEGLVELTEPVSSYTVDYVKLQPSDGDFTTDLPAGAPERDDLVLDPRSEGTVRALLPEITEPGAAPVDVARDIQAYLRGTSFTYSEELAEETAEGTRPEEPLVRFLETRQGYCVQFASAMIMLSRAAGIPARMAVGFLPGIQDGEEWVVQVDDAHAWPELFFPRLGWVRFEPTPGVRTGAPPTYTLESSQTGPGAAPIPSASSSDTTTGGERPEQDDTIGTTDTTADTTTGGPVQLLSDHLLTVLAVLAVVVLVLLVPGGAWLARRSALRRARDEAERVEAEWESLVLRLGDIGVSAADGATPRQATTQLGRNAYLSAPESAALGRVTSTLEQARYARPGAPVDDVGEDARTVWRAALSRRRRIDQARALLLPEEGLRWWRSVLRGGGGRRERTAGGDEGDRGPTPE
jgi:transglutaminase-like putative cysteine protease